MRPTLHLSIAAAVCSVLAALPGDAAAFERTMTCGSFGTPACRADEEPKPLEWPVRCLRYRQNNDETEEFPSDDGQLSDKARSLVNQSFRVWQDPDCSDLQLVEGELTDSREVGYDSSLDFLENTNLVIWQDDNWPASKGASSIALTSVTYSVRTGRIADADIEINSRNFDFADLDRPGQSVVDVRNAMVHEVGHFIGFDHNNNSDSTMFASANPGEIKKRTLEDDDIDGLCAVYPTGQPAATCDSPEDFQPPEGSFNNPDPKQCTGGCCCSSAPDSPGSYVGLLVLLVGAVGLRYFPRSHDEA